MVAGSSFSIFIISVYIHDRSGMLYPTRRRRQQHSHDFGNGRDDDNNIRMMRECRTFDRVASIDT
jgi:hypothetical protein